MTQKQLERLFRPFSQGDSSTTRKYGGTGLGLAICKRLVEAMDGRIWVTSTVGEGSSFCLRLHVTVQAETEAVGSDERSAPELRTSRSYRAEDSSHEGTSASSATVKELRKSGEAFPLRIAVAEDNLSNQRLLSVMLKRLGWDPVFRKNGKELIEYLKENPADVIIMDLQMPVMDGYEATDVIRSGALGEAIKDIKIVALTANALQRDEEKCLQVGMDAYLSKPIKFDLLEKTILKVLAQGA